MDDESVRRFLAQFEASRKNISEWPTWMQQSAVVAVASLPKSIAESQAIETSKTEAPGK